MAVPVSETINGGAVRAAHSPPRDYWHDLELLYLLMLKELRVRYKGSFLGYIWALANPLAYALVYYLTFQIIIRIELPNYAAHLISGLFPWSWATSALVQSASSYRDNEMLVRKVSVPRALLPLSIVAQHMLHFLFAFPIVLGAVVLATERFYWASLLLAPLMILVQLALLYPMALILAATSVIVRDVEYLIGIFLQLLFFLTPIVYAANAIPVEYAAVFNINPFSSMITAWRSILYEGRLHVAAVAYCLAFAGVASLAATAIHKRVGPRVAEAL
jgi:lipopolysaccharide transport system permease protein